ncbi:hypothetical protein ACFL02_05465, partial [Planctomycetota bacterium]
FQLYLVGLDGLRRCRGDLAGAGHEALISLAASSMKSPNLSRTDYIRLFNRYIRFLKLPETHNRLSRHALWNNSVLLAHEKSL